MRFKQNQKRQKESPIHHGWEKVKVRILGPFKVGHVKDFGSFILLESSYFNIEYHAF